MENELTPDLTAASEPDKKRQKTSADVEKSKTHVATPETQLDQDKAVPKNATPATIRQPTVLAKPHQGTNKELSNALSASVADKQQPVVQTKAVPKPKMPHATFVKTSSEKPKDILTADTTSVEKEGERSHSLQTKKLSTDPKATAKLVALKAAEVNALANERLALEHNLENIATSLAKKLQSLEADIEKQEEEYIAQTWAHGNVMRGWDGFVRRVDKSEKTATGNGSGTATGAPKHRKSRPSDRIFSLSSSTSNFRRENPDAINVKRPSALKKKKKR